MSKRKNKMQSQSSSSVRKMPKDAKMEDTGNHITECSEMTATEVKKQLYEKELLYIEEIRPEIIFQVKNEMLNIMKEMLHKDLHKKLRNIRK